MKVRVNISLEGLPPNRQTETATVTRELVYERKVVDFEHFIRTMNATLLNELPVLFSEALEEFRGILPKERPVQEPEPRTAPPPEQAPAEA